MRTGELAGEGFLARVGSQVRDKCEARSLREATTGARGPFTGVVGFVHANVICGGQKTSGRSGRRGMRQHAKLKGGSKNRVRRTFVQVAYERVQVIKGSTAVFPLTSDKVEGRSGVRWLVVRSSSCRRLSAVMDVVVEIGRSAVLR